MSSSSKGDLQSIPHADVCDVPDDTIKCNKNVPAFRKRKAKLVKFTYEKALDFHMCGFGCGLNSNHKGICDAMLFKRTRYGKR